MGAPSCISMAPSVVALVAGYAWTDRTSGHSPMCIQLFNIGLLIFSAVITELSQTKLHVATRDNMANAKEESMYESARLNLLEVIEERNRALNRVRKRHQIKTFYSISP